MRKLIAPGRLRSIPCGFTSAVTAGDGMERVPVSPVRSSAAKETLAQEADLGRVLAKLQAEVVPEEADAAVTVTVEDLALNPIQST